MRGVSKKMFISILTSVIVMVTMVATTFAWVGIFTYANTENFNINLKVQDLDVNYYLTISATGEKGSFSDEANLIDIEKQILKNQGIFDENNLDKLSDKEIEALYSRNSTTTPSSCIIENNQLVNFYSINMRKTGYYETYVPNIPYLKFDLYLSVNTREGIQDETEINSNVFLSDIANSLEGTLTNQRLTNFNPYSEMPSIPDAYGVLKNLPDNQDFLINSKNAARFALCVYEPIDINETYNNELPINTIIYQGGTYYPNMEKNVFNLGGNLPEDYNTALRELLIVRPNYKSSDTYSYLYNFDKDLNTAINRGKNDLELVNENSQIWSKYQYADKNYLGVMNGIQTKMKITVYFWFEGWDSDCVVGINEKPVTLNLSFTAGVEE